MKQDATTFWAKVKRGAPGDCWPWQANVLKSTGFGQVSWGNRMYTAHRVAAWLSGMIRSPAGPKSRRSTQFIRHTCSNLACCNPKHLFVGTRDMTADRFWDMVQDGPADACWEWQGHTSRGYGQVGWKGKVRPAHRVAAYLLGIVPTIAAPKDKKGGGFIMHTCDNRLCCNPSHMEVGTYKQNARDMVARGRNRNGSKQS